jgi:hypothetical protein
MSLTAPPHSSGTHRAAYDLIWEYVQFLADDFFEMVPPDFIELLYPNILPRRPFQIIEKVIAEAPSAIDKLIELGVIELIASKADYHEHEFETALSRFECLMAHPIGKPALYILLATKWDLVDTDAGDIVLALGEDITTRHHLAAFHTTSGKTGQGIAELFIEGATMTRSQSP